MRKAFLYTFGIFLAMLASAPARGEVYRDTTRLDSGVCASQMPVEWRGKKYYAPDTYYAEQLVRIDTTYIYEDDLITELIDSVYQVYQLNLVVYPEYLYNRIVDVCEGDSIVFRGRSFTGPGDFYDTVPSVNGCDSVEHIFVRYHMPFEGFEEHYLDASGKFVWARNNKTYTQPGTYDFQTQTVYGCDSVWHLHLKELPSYLFKEQATYCLSKTDLAFTWRGQTITESGTYYDRYSSVDGRDSVYQLDIIVYPYYDYSRTLTICDGGSVTFGGKTYTQGGVYTDSLLSVGGCDSVITTIVNVERSFHHYDTVYITNQESLSWHGQTITQGGNFFDYNTSAVSGCDSVYQLTVYLSSVYIYTKDTAICQTETPYIWRGKECDQLGTHTYEDRYTTVTGQDSIYRLTLTVYPAYRFDHAIILCPGETQEFRGKKYVHPGDYYDTLRTIHGCDSICHIHVIRKEAYYNEEHISLNDGQSFYWPKNGETYTEVGTYEIHEKTAEGCDSTMILFITRNPKYFFPETREVCQPDTLPYFVWRGREINESGVYWDSLQTKAGQDSVYKLNLTIHPRYISYEDKDVCESENFTWRGQTITRTGTYYDTLRTVHGCDSVIVLRVNMYQFETIQYDTICDGDTIYWEGQTITEEGVYKQRYPRAEGCDSVLTLNVTMFYPFTRNYSDTICETKLLAGEPYLWGPNQRQLWAHWNDQTAQYEDSIYWNCDSTRFFHLHVLRERVHIDTLTLCQGDSVEIILHDGKHRWLSQPGMYYDTIPQFGKTDTYACDSVSGKLVIVHATSCDTITRHILDKTLPFHWANYDISLSGYYADTLSKANTGCDSIVVLHAIVDTSYLYVDSVTICAPHYHGDNNPLNTPYLWQGHKQNGKDRYEIYYAGTYWDSLKTVNTKVDSVYCLIVKTLPTYHEKRIYDLCEGDSIQFANRWIREPGVYYDTLHTINGCDSVMQLTVNLLQRYRIALTRDISDRETYRWVLNDINGTREHLLSIPGTYTDTLRTVRGCDSVVVLTLNIHPTYRFEENQVICQSETPFLWHGHQYWTSGDYQDSLRTTMGYDSVFTLHLQVYDTFYVDRYVSICRGESFKYNGKNYTHGGLYLDTLRSQHGCDSVVVLHVQELPDYFFSDTVAVANRQPYTWRGRTFTHSGVYRDELQTKLNGCDSVYQLVLTIYDKEVLRDTTIRVCERDLPVRWRNRWLYDETTIYDTVSVTDVDTIWRVNLQVSRMSYKEIRHVLCEGEVFRFNGKTITSDTLYHDTIFEGYGCGTDYTVWITFRKTYTYDYTGKTRADKPYVWHIADTTYTFTQSGVFEHHTFYQGTQCDSNIYRLHLTVGEVYHFVDSVTLCESDLPYFWRNKQITQAGFYHDSLQTTLGYDSIYTLKVLEITPAYYEEKFINLCAEAGSYYYRGKLYDKKGVYYDTIPSIHGCDSIFRIVVRVMPTYEIYDTVHISDRETYTFDGRTLYTGGGYVSYGKTIYGCDSIVHLQLYVHPSYLFDEQEEICNKDTLYWHGKKLFKEGVYYDSLLTRQGYDSIYRMHLTVHPTYFFQETMTICPNRTTYIHGINISKSGIYYDTLYTIHGCDSVYRITVNEARTIQQISYDTICQGESRSFYGVEYSRTGTYRHEVGCDTLIILHLFVRTPTITEKRVVVSDEELPYRYNGREYWETNLYVDSFTNRYGCDSIAKLNFIVSEHCSPWHRIPLCTGSEIKIDSMTITRSGTYSFVRRSLVSGKMDSLYRVEVYDVPSYDMPVDVRHICEGDTVFYEGQAFTRAGTYDFRHESIYGCDSIRHLEVILHPVYRFYTEATITDYQSYRWEGKDYNTQGSYDLTYPSVYSCDSTLTLNLTVIPTQRIHTEDTVCFGEKYIWRGREITEEGYYHDTLCILGTHTSAIYSLHLVIQTPTHILSAEVPELCADAEYMEVAFTYSGAKPSSYSILFGQLAKDQGFKDVRNKPFDADFVARAPMPERRELLYLDHLDYVRPDYYGARLVFDNGTCPQAVSDSLTFLVRYPSWIIEQNWDDVVAPLKPELNGHYTFSQYDWYVNGTRQPNDGSGYLHNDQLQPGDEVVLMATRRGESYAIPSCPLVIRQAPVPVYTYPVLVYPTSAPKHAPVLTIEAPQQGQYSIYSTDGLLILSGHFDEGINQITLPAASGIYLIRTTTLQGDAKTHKVMIY